MSTVLVNFIGSSILSLMGLFVVRNISGSEVSLKTRKSITLMLLLIIVPAIMHNENYSYIFSAMIYAMMIIIYKEILDISIIKSTISCGIMMIALVLLDIIANSILAIFITVEQLRNIWYLNIIINIVFSAILVLIFNSKHSKEIFPKFIAKMEGKRAIMILIATIISIVTMYTILYTLSNNFSINEIFTENIMLFLVFFILITILLRERNSYESLSDEYDNLFKYIQIFEDWIEKEQLTRHEYKNQLAILRSLTKEKKVKEKIDSIVEDFINIDNDIITQLKSMPNGGLKGLLYYKISIAKKKDINIYIDVDEISGKLLSEISDDRQKILTKLLGIYMDNAIEAATDSKKKNISIEIYRIKEDIRIVISNTYSNDEIISNRNLKGVSTKGKGRGNGLYFANKLISMNDWVSDKQEIIGNYYIQNLIIKK